MAYLATTLGEKKPKKETRIKKFCARCGSVLIEITQTTKEVSNFKSPLTVTVYRCSDKECQDAINKHKAEVVSQRIERELRATKRKHLTSR